MTEIKANSRSWYLVYTKPKQETVAQQQLEQQGYVTYLPMIMNVKRRNGRRRHVNEPFFPRYLFIHLDQSHDNWAPIRSTLGVSTLVRFGQMPTPISEEIIEAIRSRENPDGLQHVKDEISKGVNVRVLDGPMAGLEGVFVARTGEQRVMLLLELMGKTTRVQIDMEAIEVVS
ncbi:transcription/translation regulatory transformer protein RfaH [Sulfuriflexus mobilis]|uniref:transcription/translation regulatory transformer protein RfaH n=1 Tax=Sulfuriflexus mobilis TaxID=1811807 RepID=UPI000F81FA31|nr:transcription/translation regulatory transformer protein RfaH [Sulfuriflexus mobilis]